MSCKQYSKNLDPVARSRYFAKLKAAGLDLCPYEIEAGLWINDPTKWPDVQYPDIYAYLIETPGVFTREAMKNYKSLEAHNYFVSGWVDTVHHIETSTGSVLFKANVKPSQRINDKPHHPWVAVQNNGSVLAAHCDCMAGLGESCSHVAALLFKMEAAVRLGYTRTLCTDKPCMWNQCFAKKVEAAPVHRILFYSEKVKDKLRAKGKKPTHHPKKATTVQQHSFLKALQEVAPTCVGLSTFSAHCEKFVPPKSVSEHFTSCSLPNDLRTFYIPDNKDRLEDKLQEAVTKLNTTTTDQLNYLTAHTIHQSSSIVWHEMRLGRITASNAHSVLQTDQNNPAPSIIKKICMPSKNLDYVPSIQWGKAHEATAVQEYTDIITNYHQNLTVSPTGLWLAKDYPFLGATPDSIVTCDCCGQGTLEVKCPFSHRDSHLEEILADRTGCIYDDGQGIKLKKTHSYYTQLQTQMFVCNTQYGDFVLWTPKTSVFIRVTRDNFFISQMLDRLQLFWHSHCLPELLARRLELGGSSDTVSDSTRDSFLYCSEE